MLTQIFCWPVIVPRQRTRWTRGLEGARRF